MVAYHKSLNHHQCPFISPPEQALKLSRIRTISCRAMPPVIPLAFYGEIVSDIFPHRTNFEGIV